MQARVSDAEDSEPPNRPRPTYSPLLRSVHGDEETNSPMPPAGGDTGMGGRVSDSGRSSRSGRSHRSQSSLSGSNLAPEDSHSNSGSSLPYNSTSPPYNSSMPRHPYHFGYSDRDRRYEQDPDMVWDQFCGWYSRTTGPYPAEGSQARSASPGHRYPSPNSSDSSSEGPTTPRHYGDTIRSSRRNDFQLYDDEEEDPYVPRHGRSRYEEQIALEEQAYEEEQIALEEQQYALQEQIAAEDRARYRRHGYY